jgi:hypothetical protein
VCVIRARGASVVSGRFATVNRVVPQLQLPLIAIVLASGSGAD